MRALCVGRHPYLSEHYARFFGRLGMATEGVVGLEAAVRSAEQAPPDLVICEYGVLSEGALSAWEAHPVLGLVPVMAVSLTSRPEEVPLLDAHGVAGFLYLPMLRPEDARRGLPTAAPPAGYVLPTRFGAVDRPAAALPPL